jgi:hypothetical protein
LIKGISITLKHLVFKKILGQENIVFSSSKFLIVSLKDSSTNTKEQFEYSSNPISMKDLSKN